MNLKKRISSILLSSSILIGSMSMQIPMTVNAESDANFAKALQYSMYFYDANMCGTEVSENTLYKWRGDCHTYDSELILDSTNTNLTDSFISQYKDILDPDGNGTVDVTGGYHDAGDHVKFGLPEAYTSSTLAWGYYEFKDAYVKTGQADHIETLLKYVADYFMRSTYRDKNDDVVAFCYQVGDGDIDHAYWQAPEVDSMERKGWFATKYKPTTDVIGSTAAALASTYMVLKESDSSYADQCLDYAKALFKFAEENDKIKGDSEDGPKGYYASNKWEDDYCWGAAWLYMATQDKHYLDEAVKYLDYYAPASWVHCWNDVWGGAMCILAEAEDLYNVDIVDMYRKAQGKSEYEEIDFWSMVGKTVDNWMTGQMCTITPEGYSFLQQWGSARYNTAAQLMALVYDNHNGGASKYSEWAKGQMEYLMGDNKNNKCYIVGLNENSVKYPHHRAASGLSKCEDTSEHRHVLYGALVGGPGANDEHTDTTADYIFNEVTIDYNAAFVGACAGLYNFYGNSSMQITPDFPPAEPESENGGNNYWVRAYAVDDPQGSGAGVTKIAMLVETDSVVPKTDISVRYYFSNSEMNEKSNISLVKGDELYDQTGVETEYNGEISGPYKYTGNTTDDDIYYFEVKWDGYKIANSNKKYQYAMGLYWGDNWDPSNDWSYQGLLKLNSTSNENDGKEEKTDYICVYSDGVLVGGIEPDGSTPKKEETTKPDVLVGDFNKDGLLNIFDLSLMKYFVFKNNDEYKIIGDFNSDKSFNLSDVVKFSRFILNCDK